MKQKYHSGPGRRKREKIVRSLFFIVAMASIFTLALIVAFSLHGRASNIQQGFSKRILSSGNIGIPLLTLLTLVFFL
jgi:hypothetical protein